VLRNPKIDIKTKIDQTFKNRSMDQNNMKVLKRRDLDHTQQRAVTKSLLNNKREPPPNKRVRKLNNSSNKKVHAMEENSQNKELHRIMKSS